MSMGNDQRKGKKGKGDAHPKSVFDRMGQGTMTRKPLVRGLFEQMGQGGSEPSTTRQTFGKNAGSGVKAINFKKTVSKA